MLPTQADVHVDEALTDFAQMFLNQEDSFVFDKVFSSKSVAHASDKYFTYSRDDFWRDQGDGEMLLAPGAPVKRGGYRMSTDSYSCDVRAWAKAVPREIAANAQPAINAEQDAIKYVLEQLRIRHERQFMTEFFTTSVWGTDLTPSALWSNYSTSDPLTDIKETGRHAIESVTGKKPNTLLVGPRVHTKLIKHPLVQELFKVTNVDSVTEDMMARVFDVDRYIVARAVYATNVEGATGAYDYAAGKHALLCYVAPDDTDGATAGRCFKWSGWGNSAGVAIQSYYEEQTRSTIIEGFTAIDNKVVSSACGYFFNGAVA